MGGFRYKMSKNTGDQKAVDAWAMLGAVTVTPVRTSAGPMAALSGANGGRFVIVVR